MCEHQIRKPSHEKTDWGCHGGSDSICVLISCAPVISIGNSWCTWQKVVSHWPLALKEKKNPRTMYHYILLHDDCSMPKKYTCFSMLSFCDSVVTTQMWGEIHRNSTWTLGPCWNTCHLTLSKDISYLTCIWGTHSQTLGFKTLQPPCEVQTSWAGSNLAANSPVWHQELRF